MGIDGCPNSESQEPRPSLSEFSLDFVCVNRNGNPAPDHGVLTCEKKNWSWSLDREKMGLYQGVHLALRRLPAKLLDDSNRFDPENPDGCRLSSTSSISSSQNEIETWWHTAVRLFARQELGDLTTTSMRYSARPVVDNVYKINFAESTVVSVADSASSCSSAASSVFSYRSAPTQPEHKVKGLDLSEALGEFIGCLANYAARFNDLTPMTQKLEAKKLLEEAEWLSLGCTIYLKLFSAAWLKGQNIRAMLGDVLTHELQVLKPAAQSDSNIYRLLQFFE
jgi:hypothetical protein